MTTGPFLQGRMAAPQTPAVSVVIPTFNRPGGTHRAIRSVLAQTAVAAEVVVVDDASAPPFALDSELIADERVRVIALTRNAGAAAARNRGVRESQGEWIAFLDSDDVWVGDHLAARLAAAQTAAARDPGRPLAVAAGFTLIKEATGTTRRLIPIGCDRLAGFAAGCWFCPGSTLLMRRSDFTALGGFDPSLRRFEDYELFLRFAQAGGALHVFEEVVADIHVGTRPSPAVAEAAAAAILARYEATLPADAARRMLAYLALERLSAAFYNGRRGQALYWLARSWLHHPRLRAHIERWWTAA